MEDINLIRKIAWSFHASTKIEYGELFCEASLAYCEALDKYKPGKGKKSTWLWRCMQQRLIDFYNKEQKYKFFIDYSDEIVLKEPPSNDFSDFYKTLPNTCQQIADLLLNSDIDIIIEKNSRARRGFITKLLRENNWKWHDIYYGMQKFKTLFE